ncbi:MAG: hypothetical protein ABIG89_06340 [Candidatus Woesearchaeota archaeon]
MPEDTTNAATKGNGAKSGASVGIGVGRVITLKDIVYDPDMIFTLDYSQYIEGTKLEGVTLEDMLKKVETYHRFYGSNEEEIKAAKDEHKLALKHYLLARRCKYSKGLSQLIKISKGSISHWKNQGYIPEKLSEYLKRTSALSDMLERIEEHRKEFAYILGVCSKESTINGAGYTISKTPKNENMRIKLPLAYKAITGLDMKLNNGVYTFRNVRLVEIIRYVLNNSPETVEVVREWQSADGSNNDRHEGDKKKVPIAPSRYIRTKEERREYLDGFSDITEFTPFDNGAIVFLVSCSHPSVITTFSLCLIEENIYPYINKLYNQVRIGGVTDLRILYNLGLLKNEERRTQLYVFLEQPKVKAKADVLPAKYHSARIDAWIDRQKAKKVRLDEMTNPEGKRVIRKDSVINNVKSIAATGKSRAVTDKSRLGKRYTGVSVDDLAEKYGFISGTLCGWIGDITGRKKYVASAFTTYLNIMARLNLPVVHDDYNPITEPTRVLSNLYIPVAERGFVYSYMVGKQVQGQFLDIIKELDCIPMHKNQDELCDLFFAENIVGLFADEFDKYLSGDEGRMFNFEVDERTKTIISVEYNESVDSYKVVVHGKEYNLTPHAKQQYLRFCIPDRKFLRADDLKYIADCLGANDVNGQRRPNGCIVYTRELDILSVVPCDSLVLEVDGTEYCVLKPAVQNYLGITNDDFLYPGSLDALRQEITLNLDKNKARKSEFRRLDMNIDGYVVKSLKLKE